MKFSSLHEAMQDFVGESGKQSVEEFTEAILDGHAIPDLGDVSFLSKCSSLGYLSMNKCDIKVLPKFPEGLSIERLELCDNKLTGGLESIATLKSLEELQMGGNQFATIEPLKPLAALSNLRILDLTECPVTKDGSLHEAMFQMIPSLEAFNGKDADGEEVDFEDGSSDLDDYSDEESGSDEGSFDDEESDDEDGSEDDDDDSSDSDDDEDGDEDDDEEEEKERPSKAARHD
jgi:hypothetical protein